MRTIYGPEVLVGKKGSTLNKTLLASFVGMATENALEKGNTEEYPKIKEFAAFAENRFDALKERLNTQDVQIYNLLMKVLLKPKEKNELALNGTAMNVIAKFYYQHLYEKDAAIIKVGEKFSQVLSSLHRSIPMENLVLGKVHYFIMPKHLKDITLGHKNNKFKGMPGESTMEAVGVYSYFYKMGPDLPVCLILNFDLHNNPASSATCYVFSLSEGSDGKMNITTKDRLSVNNKYFNYEVITEIAYLVLNGSIYLYSEDAEIDSLKPLTNSQAKKVENGNSQGIAKAKDRMSLPVKRLYWNYSDRMYSCGEVKVKAHMRWQPCGPQWSKTKLILIEPHTRNYNKAAKKLTV